MDNTELVAVLNRSLSGLEKYGFKEDRQQKTRVVNDPTGYNQAKKPSVVWLKRLMKATERATKRRRCEYCVLIYFSDDCTKLEVVLGTTEEFENWTQHGNRVCREFDTCAPSFSEESLTSLVLDELQKRVLKSVDELENIARRVQNETLLWKKVSEEIVRVKQTRD